jgi:hypothetical protein
VVRHKGDQLLNAGVAVIPHLDPIQQLLRFIVHNSICEHNVNVVKTLGGWTMRRTGATADKTATKQRRGRPFRPGQSGNPKGRPKGARNRLGTQFLDALEADFNQHGFQAIALVREKKPEVYIRVVADLLPKEANINVEAGETFVELWRRISDCLGDELAERFDEEPSVKKH